MFLNKLLGKEPPYHKAMVAAFALVSFADGELHVNELNRFLRILDRDHHGMIGDEARLTRDVVTLGQNLARDYPAAKAAALNILSRIRDDADAAGLIMKICHAVMTSDQQTSPSEIAAIREIAAALGRDESLP